MSSVVNAITCCGRESCFMVSISPIKSDNGNLTFSCSQISMTVINEKFSCQNVPLALEAPNALLPPLSSHLHGLLKHVLVFKVSECA